MAVMAPRWDLEDPRISIPCVQSLYGHGGTVIALEHGFDVLLSSSTDGYLFVWRDSSPARLLRFPSYAVRQRIEPGHGKNKVRLRFQLFGPENHRKSQEKDRKSEKTGWFRDVSSLTEVSGRFLSCAGGLVPAPRPPPLSFWLREVVVDARRGDALRLRGSLSAKPSRGPRCPRIRRAMYISSSWTSRPRMTSYMISYNL